MPTGCKEILGRYWETDLVLLSRNAIIPFKLLNDTSNYAVSTLGGNRNCGRCSKNV